MIMRKKKKRTLTENGITNSSLLYIQTETPNALVKRMRYRSDLRSYTYYTHCVNPLLVLLLGERRHDGQRAEPVPDVVFAMTF